MIGEIEDYFAKGCGRCARFATPDCSTRQWAAGLADLRRLCRAAGLVETVKWGHPCYMQGGQNVAMIGAFRGDFCLTFLNAGLLLDPFKVLQRPGPNSRVQSVLRFSDNAAVAAMSDIVTAYLSEARGYAEAGLKAPKIATEVELPIDLIDALDLDGELAEAFHALTPGRQRSYVIALSSAKTAATRLARIEKFRPRILAGKGATER
jgi:uncharacterized protein YdeI (YjbR/CyaY-like superfamily)